MQNSLNTDDVKLLYFTVLSADLAELLVLEHKMTPIHSNIKEAARLVVLLITYKFKLEFFACCIYSLA